MSKVYWISRHDLSPAQLKAIRDLHGEGTEVAKDPMVFSNVNGLAEYIRNHTDGFVYAVAGAPHYIAAALAGLEFGVFENHPAKRQDGSFGLATVYHVKQQTLHNCDGGNWGFSGDLMPVWVNPDPTSDNGEALIPVARR